MSLLITRDYANKGTPLWVPTSGGTIDGNLNVAGNIVADGNIRAEGNISSRVFITVDPSGTDTGGLYFQSTATGATSNGMLIQGDLLKFTKLGTSNANTSLTLSAAGANADNFTLGGTLVASIGPVPTQLITSTKNISNVSVSPSGPDIFPVDVSLTSISNAEYDVQMTGTVYVGSGSIDASDYVVFNLATGGGGGTVGAIVFPSERLLGANYVSGIGPLTAGGAAANVNLRTRVVSGASGTVIGANVRAFSPNASSAVYGANLTFLDVQRVR
jgi:hypothetical protein